MSDLGAALAALERQKQIKLREIEKIEQAIQNMREIMGMVADTDSPTSTEYEGLSIGEAVQRLITEQGKPLTTRELAEGLLSRGLRTTSRNFSMTVYTVLRENKKVRRNGEGQWELTSLKTPTNKK